MNIKHVERQSLFLRPVFCFSVIALIVIFGALKGREFFGVAMPMFWMPVMLIFVVLSLLQLTIKFDDIGIGYKIFMFKPSFSTTKWDDIATWELRKTKGLGFGGLGFRRAKDGWAYIFNLRSVLKITTTSGKTFYLSIKDEPAVREIMAQNLSKI